LKDLLASTGVKQGSFYNYFASKEQLAQKALVDALEQRRDACADAFGADGSGIETEVRRYLSPDYRDNFGKGSTKAAVAPEIARQPESTRRAVEQKLNQIIQLLADRLPGKRSRARRTEAIAISSMMIGALQLSRVVASCELSSSSACRPQVEGGWSQL
jgi:TetR/AcrR family transcriptional repressor of nem operon